MRTPVAVATAVTVVLATAGCGGSKGESAGTSSPAAAEKRSSRCLPVSADRLSSIAEGVEQGVGTLTFREGAAVKSKDFENIYMIAGVFTAPGVDAETGVWASNSLDTGGLTMAVDGFAKQFTVWPDADKTKAEIRQGDDGVDEARECVG